MRLNTKAFIKPFILGCLTVGCAAAYAEPMRATLPDGRQVILFDDNTWQYDTPSVSPGATRAPVRQGQNSPASLPIPPKPGAGAAAVAVGTSASAFGHAGQASASQQAMATIPGDMIIPGNGKVVGVHERSGIELTLQAASYQNGELVIPTRLKNDATDAVVLVELELRLRSRSGDVIAREKHKVWTSVKRMPETYFRPGTERTGREIRLKVPQAEQYFLETEFLTVEQW